LVTFYNKLKTDAVSTISALHAAEIDTKIITGDNLFLGVKIAFMTGIIRPEDRVIVLEGSRFDIKTGSKSISVPVLEMDSNG
jgi:P-type E1-E2 ATPase